MRISGHSTRASTCPWVSTSVRLCGSTLWHRRDTGAIRGLAGLGDLRMGKREADVVSRRGDRTNQMLVRGCLA